MAAKLVLISHLLCPYVQRAVITLKEKGIEYERIDIDLSNKPDWFLQISPLGKTPVLLVDDQAIFESAVICEFLEESYEPALHSTDLLIRARHRSWMEFGSAILNSIGALYNASDAVSFTAKVDDLRLKFEQVENELASHKPTGPFFGGEKFCLVDAVFGPIFRYFDVFDAFEDFGILKNLPFTSNWRENLRERKSVQEAVSDEYSELLRIFLLKRNSEISRRMNS